MSNLGLFGISVLITFGLIILSCILLFGLPLIHLVLMINMAIVESVTGVREHAPNFSLLVSLLSGIEILLFSTVIYGVLYLFVGK